MKINSDIIDKIKLWEKEKQEIETTIEFFSKTDLQYVFRALFAWIYNESFRYNKITQNDEISLPNDLNYIDLLEITLILVEKFWLKNELKTDLVLLKIKILIWKILKKSNTDNLSNTNENDLRRFFSSNTIDKINNINIEVNSKTKNILKNIKNNKEDNKENGDEIYNLFESIKNEITNLFIYMFFKKWIKDIINNQTNYNQINFEFDSFKNNHLWHYKDKKELDEDEKLLKDKIDFQKYKEVLKENNPDDKIKILKEVFDLIKQYPYSNEWHKVWITRWIIENKHINCTWQTLISHAILNEIWIEHSAIITKNHICIWIEIDWLNYLFDPTNYKELYQYNIWASETKNYNHMYLIDNFEKELQEDIDFIQIDIEKWLIQSMLSTISNYYYENNNFENALFYNKQWINAELRNINLINYRAKIHKNCWNKSISELWDYLKKYLTWNNKFIWIKNRKIKKEIKSLVDKNDLKSAIKLIFSLEKN